MRRTDSCKQEKCARPQKVSKNYRQISLPFYLPKYTSLVIQQEPLLYSRNTRIGNEKTWFMGKPSSLSCHRQYYLKLLNGFHFGVDHVMSSKNYTPACTIIILTVMITSSQFTICTLLFAFKFSHVVLKVQRLKYFMRFLLAFVCVAMQSVCSRWLIYSFCNAMW